MSRLPRAAGCLAFSGADPTRSDGRRLGKSLPRTDDGMIRRSGGAVASKDKGGNPTGRPRATVGLLIMAFFYDPLSRGVWQVQRYVTRDKNRLGNFTACLFATPILIIALSALI
jgi:hypothetical protein